MDKFKKIIKESYKHDLKGFHVPTNKDWLRVIQNNGFDEYIGPNDAADKLYVYLSDVEKTNPMFNAVMDFSKPHNSDLCKNVQLISDNVEKSLSHSICVNISCLKPYYHIHVLTLKRNKSDFSKWMGLPERNILLENGEFKTLIKQISAYLQESLHLEKFPEELLNKVVDGYFTENHPQGEFSYYNAFFMDDFYTR